MTLRIAFATIALVVAARAVFLWGIGEVRAANVAPLIAACVVIAAVMIYRERRTRALRQS